MTIRRGGDVYIGDQDDPRCLLFEFERNFREHWTKDRALVVALNPLSHRSLPCVHNCIYFLGHYIMA
jgi:hypothetical protein